MPDSIAVIAECEAIREQLRLANTRIEELERAISILEQNTTIVFHEGRNNSERISLLETSLTLPMLSPRIGTG